MYFLFFKLRRGGEKDPLFSRRRFIHRFPEAFLRGTSTGRAGGFRNQKDFR